MMLADSYMSDMSAGAMVCKSMLDIKGRKIFVYSNNGEMVLENICDLLEVLSTIDVATCMLRLIMR